MRVYRSAFIADAFRHVLKDLYYSPEFTSNPRGMEVREIINCVIEIENPNLNMYENKFRSSQKKYIAAEALWYFSGTNKIDFISNYASMWKNLTNADGTVNSAYGNLIFNEKNEHGFTQYEWVIESLKKDKDSRQAIMHFNKPHHQFLENKDQVCTLVALFHIRNNELKMTLNMRSNDVILGFMTDFTFFNILHQQVYLHMKQYYPEIIMGSYTHTSHSMHLYARHYDLVENMLTADFKPIATPRMTTSIIDEQGNVLPEYKAIFDAVLNNTPVPDGKVDNTLLSWAIPFLL